MRLLKNLIALCAATTLAIYLPAPSLAAEQSKPHTIQKKTKRAKASSLKHTPRQRPSTTRFRGWEYLVERLRQNNVPEKDLIAIYANPRMPEYSFVPFSLKPKEPASIYRGFNHPRHHALGASFIERHGDTFDRVEKTLRVPREVVAAILVVESQIGRNTGNQMIIYRLSRLASTNSPENLRMNYQAKKKLDPSITFEQVKQRGRYLAQTFLPEIPALIEIAKRNQVDVLSMKGSSAGAFGMPQFLPSAFLRYGMDGDKDGIVSLHDEEDALWSTANYLANFGYRDDIPLQEKRSIIWRYNKSKSYIDTILKVSESIEEASGDPSSRGDER